MPKQTELTIIFVAIAILSNLLIVRGIAKGKPPGQRGLAGTDLANSQLLLWIQVACLAALEAACLIGIYLLWWR